MADEIAAKITINGNNSDANVSGSTSGVFKDLLNEFKDLKNIFGKAFTLQRSGLGGGLLGGTEGAGGILGLLKNPAVLAAIATATGIVSGTEAATSNSLAAYSPEFYEKIQLQNGEESVLEIDSKTGEILRTLTLEQAKEEGILDSKSRIKSTLETQNSFFDTMTSNIEKSRDATYFTTDNLGLIQAETDAQLRLQKEITALLAEKARKLGGKGETSSGNIGNTSSIPFVQEYGNKQSISMPSTDELNKMYYSDLIKSSTQEGYLSTEPLAGFIDLNLLKK